MKSAKKTYFMVDGAIKFPKEFSSEVSEICFFSEDMLQKNAEYKHI